jgi:hypothetical protein
VNKNVVVFCIFGFGCTRDSIQAVNECCVGSGSLARCREAGSSRDWRNGFHKLVAGNYGCEENRTNLNKLENIKRKLSFFGSNFTLKPARTPRFF